jgi:anthranilate/para-aminobenzoate synthase component I
VGGAITIQADAEKEYEECLVKVKRMVQLFGDDQGI